ncbi:MAG: 50S ribosomal protein L5 [Gammaproteobacteria bacterium]|nr:50S ribosomal protein L5 [Gammaproteobacteria bacterium]MYD79881.1 50S ribosomal protein L5 [Gammaproteobacteria bacterium]
MNTLQEKYLNEIRPQLMSQYGFSSVMRVPRLEKVTLNMGVGQAVGDRKLLDSAFEDLMKIAGQRPKITRARKSEAVFKIRTGYAIGCMVTLRRTIMYEFVERLIGIAIPRVRDFRGLSPRAFDGRGNYSIGVTEQIIFPEINYDEIDSIRGLDIAITTTARNDDEGLDLLRAFNFPFRS